MPLYPITGLDVFAGETIQPYRFVKLSAAGVVSMADANEAVIGVTAPMSEGHLATAHATAGNQATVYSVHGSVVLVQPGGDITAGAYVKAGADGVAVAAATTGTTAQNIAGIALEAGAAATGLIKVLFFPSPLVYPALS